MNWPRERSIGFKKDPSGFYVRFTLDWLQAPFGSHRPEFSGNGIAFYVSLGGLFKDMP